MQWHDVKLKRTKVSKPPDLRFVLFLLAKEIEVLRLFICLQFFEDIILSWNEMQNALKKAKNRRFKRRRNCLITALWLATLNVVIITKLSQVRQSFHLSHYLIQSGFKSIWPEENREKGCGLKNEISSANEVHRIQA